LWGEGGKWDESGKELKELRELMVIVGWSRCIKYVNMCIENAPSKRSTVSLRDKARIIAGMIASDLQLDG